MTSSLRRRVAKVEADRQPQGVQSIETVFVNDDEPVPPAAEGCNRLVVRFISPEWAKANPERLAR